MRLCRRFVFLFIFIFSCVLAIEAEEKQNLNVKIEQIISKDYPEMTAYTVIKNNKGELVSGLAPGLFSFRIDTAEIKVKSKIVPFSMSDEGVDYTIMISNNGIMEGEPFDFQKNALLKFVELMSDRDTLSIYTIGEDAAFPVEFVARKIFQPLNEFSCQKLQVHILTFRRDNTFEMVFVHVRFVFRKLSSE